jgi:hypothetical protein
MREKMRVCVRVLCACGVLAYLLVLWFFGSLALWFFGSLALLFFGFCFLVFFGFFFFLVFLSLISIQKLRKYFLLNRPNWHSSTLFWDHQKRSYLQKEATKISKTKNKN